MAYVNSFKKFISNEEKNALQIEAGANPVTPTDPAQANNTDTTKAAPSQASVESDPAVIAARSAVVTATANRDKAISAKQAELDKLKSDQDTQVNNATLALNNALQKAATAK
jgi:hypothetical protein